MAQAVNQKAGWFSEEKGAALLEAAIALPVFLTLAFLIFDTSRIFFQYSAVLSALDAAAHRAMTFTEALPGRHGAVPTFTYFAYPLQPNGPWCGQAAAKVFKESLEAEGVPLSVVYYDAAEIGAQKKFLEGFFLDLNQAHYFAGSGWGGIDTAAMRKYHLSDPALARTYNFYSQTYELRTEFKPSCVLCSFLSFLKKLSGDKGKLGVSLSVQVPIQRRDACSGYDFRGVQNQWVNTGSYEALNYCGGTYTRYFFGSEIPAEWWHGPAYWGDSACLP